jgi:hypothetical protein
VTGKSSISGFVNLDIFFLTDDGPVKLNVDAYIVDGMSTPFILGNDFVDQYSISIIREEGEAHIRFGNSGRTLKVETSTSSSMTDDEGHAFKISVMLGVDQRGPNLKRKARLRQGRSEVWSTQRVVIPPETSVAVLVHAYFAKGQDSLLVEKQISNHRNGDDLMRNLVSENLAADEAREQSRTDDDGRSEGDGDQN